MDFTAKNTDVLTHNTQCAVVFAAGSRLLPSAAQLDERHQGALTHALGLKTESSAGQCTWITLPPASKTQSYDRVLLVQLGTKDAEGAPRIGAREFLKVATALFGAVADSPAKNVSVHTDDLALEGDDSTELAKLLARAALAACYRYTTTKASNKASPLKKVLLSGGDLAANKKGLALGHAMGQGVNLARELGNLPGNICTPTYLADSAKKMAEGCEQLTVEVLGEKQMKKLGMGALLSVARGSDEEAKLIVLNYRNGPEKAAPHVLVGKGITFDTGGISIKPGPQMDEMKFDMCGAASVLGTLHALVQLKAPLNVIGIIAAAENMPSGGASKPGDVVTSMSGQTIEILNTDAEGRLVLCDALTYAERFKPATIVDIATLTGACVIALGNHASGLYANDDALAEALLAAGERGHDRAWRMPLWEEYQKGLDSNFADMANVGPREGGSITAACFLARYTKNMRWAHLDIAGSAWNGGAKKGATGRPVSLLLEYLLAQ